jgi:hypothetical protein
MNNTPKLTARYLYEFAVSVMGLSRREVLDRLQCIREHIEAAGPGRHVRLRVHYNAFMAEAEWRAATRSKDKDNKYGVPRD